MELVHDLECIFGLGQNACLLLAASTLICWQLGPPRQNRVFLLVCKTRSINFVNYDTCWPYKSTPYSKIWKGDRSQLYCTGSASPKAHIGVWNTRKTVLTTLCRHGILDRWYCKCRLYSPASQSAELTAEGCRSNVSFTHTHLTGPPRCKEVHIITHRALPNHEKRASSVP